MAATTYPIPVLQRLDVPNRPGTTIACLALTDSISLLSSVGISVLLKAAIQGDVHLESYLRLWPLLFVFLLVYATIGLYSIVALNPPEELRRATIASAVLFLLLGAVTVSFRGAQHQFTWTLLVALAVSIVLFPLLRACTRQMFAARSWWGYPAIIFGAGKAGERIVNTMLEDPSLSLKPIALVDENSGKTHIGGVPVFRSLAHSAPLIPAGRRAYGVFAAQDLPSASLGAIIERHRGSFSHILVIPELTGMASLWVNPKNIGGMLGLEISQSRIHDRAKRVLDLFLAVLFAVFAGPACILLCILIRLDSPGPALYSQRRIGVHGRPFRAWKFRSMVTDSQQMLARHLAADPDALKEWKRSQKLRNDPRVTRTGRFLRKSSLDELPQVWNVLRGEMSFVGPRPIVENEIHHYGESFDLYKRVRGGITGLWQVSGRSDTTYAERVTLDSFYARNWSVWLDLCILFRTFSVVLFGKGAY